VAFGYYQGSIPVIAPTVCVQHHACGEHSSHIGVPNGNDPQPADTLPSATIDH